MYFLKRNNEEFSLQIANFAIKIPVYEPTFGLSPDDIVGVTKDSAYFQWCVISANQVADTKKGWTGFRNIVRYGQPYILDNPAPEAVEVAPVPSEVAPGIQVRFISLVNRIKAHPNYTEAVGLILGIESTPQNRVIGSGEKPQLKLITSGGNVIVQWRKGGFDGIVIEKDTGAGFVVLDKDMHPNYTDPAPLPIGHSAIWKYQAMYIYKDNRVGDWSDVVSITVGR